MNKGDTRLLITSVGPHDSSHLRELTSCITDTECNVEQSQVAILGNEIAGLFLVSGNWDAIARLETALNRFSKKHDVVLSVRRTEARTHSGDRLPYLVEVVAADDPGIINHLTGFFYHRNIVIDSLSSNCYEATQTGTRMFSAHLSVLVPVNAQITALREEFMEFCERLNLDAMLEPVKN